MPNHKSTLQIYGLILTVAFSIFGTFQTKAFSPDFYATSSALSQGQWAKVEVSETGMQFISDATLRNLGFSDPEKVNVFGYGGVMIPENLNSPDDLPVVSSMRVNGGIIFFGKASSGWSKTSSGLATYYHISHPYSDVAYYFVSDCLEERKNLENSPTVTTPGGEPITIFTERLLHEQEVSMPISSGRLILGEDFKTNSTHSFNFPLPGNTGNAIVTTAFASKTSGGTSSITISANGKPLSSSGNDQMTYTDTKLIVSTKTVKEVDDPGTSLNLSIKFNPSGVVTTAGLDYIEVEYPRTIQIVGSELYFYISPTQPSEVRVESATPSTVVWDVTDHTSPRLMAATLNGTTLSFSSQEGYHEYVAFDPSRITRGVIPANKVSNQDIHAMEAPDMVIISPSEYLPAAQRLVTLHQQTDGIQAIVLTPEEIYNEFSSGKPDVSAFRKMLKMWYDRAEGKEGEYPAYCLIMSRPTYDNKMVMMSTKNCGYPRIPIWQSPTGETETTTYSTDDYIGMLDDAVTFNIASAYIHVAVGRMPVKSLTEANYAVDKLEKFLSGDDLGAWKNNVIVLADDQDNGVHLEQAENVVAAMQSNENGKNFIYEKLYFDSYPLEYTGTGASYPLVTERLLNKWNEGTALIDYIGHANEKAWSHEYILNWTHITSMTNSRLPYLYAATCNFMRWDEDEVSGGEILWLYPNSGVIGMICPSREVLITANGTLNSSTAKYMFMLDSNGLPLTAGDIMVKGKNDSNTGANKLRYGLMGDPAMRMPWPSNRIVVDKINDVELDSAEDLPILSARSSVKMAGHVADHEGNLIQDFNGIAEITLFDAEKVITTNGNGSDGVVAMYNDRKTRLYVGRTKVTNGEWSTNFTMPSEIENNYLPALVSLYAYDGGGREANGHTEKVYAYGYDETAPDDFTGPKIIEFYLDSPSFVSGNQVSPNPTLYAKFYDESGISVSEAGIGHNITLELDGKTFFDDVAQYYMPDAEEEGAGSITYGLSDIMQGNHTLKLTVWDNANNSTNAYLDFCISALWKPAIQTLTTDVNPAVSSVNFIVATDGSTNSMECAIEVFDMWGKRVWRDNAPSMSKNQQRTTMGWNLCDFSGARVPGGIYLYRATVKTDTGATVTKTKKLIVAHQ